MASIFLTKRVTRIPHYVGSTTTITGSYPFSSAHQGPKTESKTESEQLDDSSSHTSSGADIANDYRRKEPALECGLSDNPFDDLSSFKNCFGTTKKVMYTHKDSWEGNWSLARASPKKVPSTVSEGISQPINTAEQRSVQESVKSDDNH